MSKGLAILQHIARGTASLAGRRSGPIRAIRPVYENLLDRLTSGGGVPVEINGVPFRVDPHFRSCFPPSYDPEVAALLDRCVRPDSLCLNVGANTGIYALQLAHWARPNGRVIAFEPNPAARDVLMRHVRLNHLETRVEIEPYAIGARRGTSLLYTSGFNGMSRMGAPNPEIAQAVNAVTVEVISLDDYCRHRAIAPDVVVMDIEGFEIAALEGARNLIESRRGKMLLAIEMHPPAWEAAGTTRARAEALLASMDLSPIALTGQSDPLADYGQVVLAYRGFQYQPA